MVIVPGATIKLNGVTFPAGQYHMGLPAKRYSYMVTKTGYYPASRFIQAVADLLETVTLVPISTS